MITKPRLVAGRFESNCRYTLPKHNFGFSVLAKSNIGAGKLHTVEDVRFEIFFPSRDMLGEGEQQSGPFKVNIFAKRNKNSEDYTMFFYKNPLCKKVESQV